jgi:non-homologous end joining protein Ku
MTRVHVLAELLWCRAWPVAFRYAITEFLPLERLDPVYFDESYCLGSVANAARAYRLLADAMSQSGLVTLGRFTMRGKEHLVLIRPSGKGLMLYTIYFSDEVGPEQKISIRRKTSQAGSGTHPRQAADR